MMKKFNNLNSTLRLILCLTLLGGTSQVIADPEDPLNQLLRQRQQQQTAPAANQRDEAGLNRLIQNKSAETPATTRRINVAPRTQSAAAPAANSKSDADALISNAMGFLGVAYRFGGASPSGFDCSGFMQYVFRKAFAVNLPRVSAEQAKVGVHVSRANLQAGDMVFFRTRGKRISHVGMYVGNGRFIHAPRTGKRIEITSLNNKYWSARYATARRVKRNNAQNFIR